MNDTVIIFFDFLLLCAGLICGQTVWVCHTVHKPGRLYAARIFQALMLHLLNVYARTEWQFLLSVQQPHTHIQHHNLQNFSKHFQAQSPPFPQAVLTKVLVVRNLGGSAFKFFPKAQSKAFCTKKAFSDFVIKKLQQCLTPLISLNAHVTCSLNMK